MEGGFSFPNNWKKFLQFLEWAQQITIDSVVTKF